MAMMPRWWTRCALSVSTACLLLSKPLEGTGRRQVVLFARCTLSLYVPYALIPAIACRLLPLLPGPQRAELLPVIVDGLRFLSGWARGCCRKPLLFATLVLPRWPSLSPHPTPPHPGQHSLQISWRHDSAVRAAVCGLAPGAVAPDVSCPP